MRICNFHKLDFLTLNKFSNQCYFKIKWSIIYSSSKLNSTQAINVSSNPSFQISIRNQYATHFSLKNSNLPTPPNNLGNWKKNLRPLNFSHLVKRWPRRALLPQSLRNPNFRAVLKIAESRKNELQSAKNDLERSVDKGVDGNALPSRKWVRGMRVMSATFCKVWRSRWEKCSIVGKTGTRRVPARVLPEMEAAARRNVNSAKKVSWRFEHRCPLHSSIVCSTFFLIFSSLDFGPLSSGGIFHRSREIFFGSWLQDTERKRVGWDGKSQKNLLFLQYNY